MKRTVFTCILLTLLGCSSQKVVQVDPSSPVGIQMTAVEREISSAKASGVDVLSPSWFSKANKSFEDAKSSIGSNAGETATLNLINQSKTELTEALKFADATKQHLPRAVEARAHAVEAGADNTMKPFEKADEAFLSLTRQIEEGKIDAVRGKELEVVALYEAVEVSARKTTTLQAAKDLVSRAMEADADSYAPTTLKATQKMISDAETFIQQNPRSLEKISELKTQAHFEAKRLFQITQHAKMFSELKPEATVLWIEENLHNLSEHLSGKDFRDVNFNEQFQAMHKELSVLLKERGQLEGESERLKGKITELKTMKDTLSSLAEEKEANIKALEAEKGEAEASLATLKAFEEKYKTVAALFTNKEAEVYKQDNKVLIRLKGLEFPAGSSELRSSNFPLLSKVRTAIKTYEKASIVIEGHTDSTGAEATNKNISQKRAESVAQYFISNEVIEASKIEAHGYGSGRPIAPNETKEGRASNRRVDVIINPEPETAVGT